MSDVSDQFKKYFDSIGIRVVSTGQHEVTAIRTDGTKKILDHYRKPWTELFRELQAFAKS